MPSYLAATDITSEFAVAAAPDAGRIAAFAQGGYGVIVNLLPDGEADTDTAEFAILTAANGLAYHHIPVHCHEVFTDQAVTAMAVVLDQATAPVVAFCRTGTRAAIVWAAARARREPVDAVLADLTRSGFDLAYLRDDLEAQASRRIWNGDTPVAPQDNATVVPQRLVAA